jgi:DNA polymerase V
VNAITKLISVQKSKPMASAHQPRIGRLHHLSGSHLQIFMASFSRHYQLNLYQQAVAAGFPSPAEDHIDKKLDLNRHLICNPAATFYVRVTGDSMIGAGIHSGDLLIVDRSLDATSGRIIIAVLHGELAVKRFCREGNRILLLAEHADCPPVEIYDPQDLHIWGVVTVVIHRV